MSPETDARLSEMLRAALSGDESAYAEFLRDIAGLIRAAARRRVGHASEPDPEDIVQETLLAIHLKRHTWRQDAAIGPWVHAIVRYKIVDAFRRRGRAVTIDIDELSESLPDEQAETVSQRDVERALSTLTDGQRRVVSAISLEGRSIAETAKYLNMKENAVRVAFHRGLAAIAKRFGHAN